MRSLVLRILYEKRWFIGGWSAVFIAMTSLVMAFYPSFSEGGGIEALASSVPQQLRGLIGDAADYRTIEGFVALQVYDIRMSLLMIIMTLVLAIGLTVREEESGELRTLLSVGLGRGRVLFEKFVAGGLIVLILNLVALGGVYIGIAMLGQTYPHQLLLSIAGLSFLFGLAVLSLPFGLALATGSRVITMSVSLSIAIGSYLLSTFARTVDWLKGWDALSIIHYLDTAGLRHQTFSFVNVWVLLAIILIMMSIGFAGFRNRDIS